MKDEDSPNSALAILNRSLLLLGENAIGYYPEKMLLPSIRENAFYGYFVTPFYLDICV